jgi:hypothetical protein
LICHSLRQESNLNEKIDNNDSSNQNDLAELYNLNTSLSDDLSNLIDNLKLSTENDLTNIKLALSVEVQRLSDSLTNYKIYAEETYAKKSELPFVPSLVEGKNIRLTETSEGNIVIDAIVPQFVGGGGISKTTVQEMIDASGGNFVSKSGDTMTGQLSVNDIAASNSAGLHLNNNSGTQVVLIGAGGGTGVTFAGNIVVSGLAGTINDELVIKSTSGLISGSKQSLSQINNGVNKSLTYDISSGKLSALTSSIGNKSFTYNGSGQLTSISGSGIFKNKTLVYSDGKLVDIIVS